jgi:predicted outer membrane repeat protein
VSAGENPLINSIIDGGSAGSVVTGAPNAKLVGFTIANGSGPLGAGLYDAGGMEATNCIFKDNHAIVHGGGAWVNSNQSVLTNCIFLGNSAGAYGGGIYIGAVSPAIIDCSFIKNSAGSKGGGIYGYGSSPTLDKCTFSGNSADNGGGICNDNSAPTITNCSFTGNLANSDGGGIYNFHSSPTVSNSAFSCNSAGEWGGGICNRDSSSLTVINCTFTGNTGFIGGIDNYSSTSVIVTSSILWENSGAYEIVPPATVTYSDIQGGNLGTGNIDADPKFVRNPYLGDDGVWGTEDDDYGDLHLTNESPCIDKGDPSASGAGDTDIDGDPRIIDGDGDGAAIRDMGADEHTIKIGDINYDGNVDLADVIIALQVLSGVGTSSTVYKEADANLDSKIGLEEVIYVLQNVSESR